MNPDLSSKLFRLGAALEKGDLGNVFVRSPLGGLMYFRANGVQVISTEAEEIDTGGSCTLVITPVAAVLSGTIIRALRVLGQKAPRQRVTGALREMIASLVVHKTKVSGTWEPEAAKTLVSIALKWAEKDMESEPQAESPRRGLDFVRPELEGLSDDLAEIIERKERRLRSAKPPAGVDDPLFDFTMGAGVEGGDQQEGWLMVAGIQGWVVGLTWMPVLGPEDVVDEKVIRKVAKGLARRGLKAELAMAVLANTRSRDEKNQKR